jgi:hypothetical protein
MASLTGRGVDWLGIEDAGEESMKHKLPLQVAGCIFFLIAVLHLVRLMGKLPVTIGTYTVPLWMSGIGGVVALGLSWWMFRSL